MNYDDSAFIAVFYHLHVGCLLSASILCVFCVSIYLNDGESRLSDEKQKNRPACFTSLFVSAIYISFSWIFNSNYIENRIVMVPFLSISFGINDL